MNDFQNDCELSITITNISNDEINVENNDIVNDSLEQKDMLINENIYNYIDLNNKSQVIDYSRLTAYDGIRVAYVLTKSYKSDRFKYCKNILENIGFNRSEEHASKLQ